MLGWDEAQALIETAIKEFPETFGLRAFPGKTFKISRTASYVTNERVVMLYTVVQDGDKWLTFCKGTVGELRNAIVRKEEQ